MNKIEKITCILCGGDGYVSTETAEQYGRHPGDSTCPSCNGEGKVISRPMKPGPHWTRTTDRGRNIWFTYDYDGWYIVASEVRKEDSDFMENRKIHTKLYVGARTYDSFDMTKEEGYTKVTQMHKKGRAK